MWKYRRHSGGRRRAAVSAAKEQDAESATCSVSAAKETTETISLVSFPAPGRRDRLVFDAASSANADSAFAHPCFAWAPTETTPCRFQSCAESPFRCDRRRAALLVPRLVLPADRRRHRPRGTPGPRAGVGRATSRICQCLMASVARPGTHRAARTPEAHPSGPPSRRVPQIWCRICATRPANSSTASA